LSRLLKETDNSQQLAIANCLTYFWNFTPELLALHCSAQ
jgi:hypothetical protein